MVFYFLYDIILLIISPAITGYYLFRSLTRGRPAALPRRFGFQSAADLEKIAGHETIWVHAVSVGETIAVKSLIRALKEQFPKKKIVISNGTETGRSIALTLSNVDLCIYFPFDFAFAVRRAIDAVKPSAIVIVETEIWPNFLKAARRRHIPVILVNGRISDRSSKRYERLKWIFRRVLGDYSALCMQSAEDGRRITAMGAKPDRVHVTGNLKYDIPSASVSDSKCQAMRNDYRIPSSLSVFTAGSTHQGEEEPLAETFKSLIADQRNLMFVLAPRHPERAEKACDILRAAGIPHRLRSALDGRSAPFRSGEVLVLDTVGELTRLYSISDLVFIGGSLVPVGGHNVLEPASFHVPVLFGPFMNNFREISAKIIDCRGGRQVADADELTEAVRGLLDDDGKRREMGRNGGRLLEENRGSTERHLKIIEQHLS